MLKSEIQSKQLKLFGRKKPIPVSVIALLFIFGLAICIRIYFLYLLPHIFQWDSLGYYMYLPAQFIYHDVKHLSWFHQIQMNYNLPGDVYQFHFAKNGNAVFFYTEGVAIMEFPFFMVADCIAKLVGFNSDGFSFLYQLAIGIGMLCYFIIGIILLRKVLIKFFSDTITAIVLVLICCSTNCLQYISVEAGMTHGYLFLMYCWMLYLTLKWHESPRIIYSIGIGVIMGLVWSIRITDSIIFLIPLFWNCQSKENRIEKLNQIRKNKMHFLWLIIATVIVIFPQLFYWKTTYGNWFFPKGSKWDFFQPHLLLLFGWEKGWFIYTPIAIFMILGLFFMRSKPYQIAVLIFVIINLWIVTAWHDWHYAASYSARALMQSLPVFSLPLGVFLDKIYSKNWRWIVLVVVIYFCFVNIFQIWQYNVGMLRSDGMDRKSYFQIYLQNHSSSFP